MSLILSAEFRLSEVQNELALDIGWRLDDLDRSLSAGHAWSLRQTGGQGIGN